MASLPSGRLDDPWRLVRSFRDSSSVYVTTSHSHYVTGSRIGEVWGLLPSLSCLLWKDLEKRGRETVQVWFQTTLVKQGK